MSSLQWQLHHVNEDSLHGVIAVFGVKVAPKLYSVGRNMKET